MKQGIHPNWHHDCQVTCSCGHTFTIGSTATTLDIDICNNCHPFFTGEVKFVDRQGRVDRFKKKMAAAQAAQQKNQAKPKANLSTANKSTKSQSYREILREQQAQLRQAAQQSQSPN